MVWALSTTTCADTLSGGDTDDAVSFSREQDHSVFKRKVQTCTCSEAAPELRWDVSR